MLKSFFGSKKWALWAYGGMFFILALLCAQVYLSLRLNDWYGEFYTLCQQATQRPVSEFYACLILFGKIATPYIGLIAITNFFTRHYAFRWRTAMTFVYLPKWRHVPDKIEGESQRIQEDTQKFAQIVESLGLESIRAILNLIAFMPLLWHLSKQVNMPSFIHGISTSIHNQAGHIITTINYLPGSLVWVALLTSIGGLAVSWMVGIKLPRLQYNNQMVEAAFRKELDLAEEDKSLFGSMPTLTELFTGIRLNYKKLFLHLTYFDTWLQTYVNAMAIVPLIVVAPNLFSGAMLLGVMMQVSNAFDKVHSSFSLFVYNFTTITELRSIRLRLTEFEVKLNEMEIPETGGKPKKETEPDDQ